MPVQGRCSKDKNQRSVTVTITDTCPECGTDHIDMQALTFNKVNALQCTMLEACCCHMGSSGSADRVSSLRDKWATTAECPGRHAGREALQHAVSSGRERLVTRAALLAGLPLNLGFTAGALTAM